MKKYESIGVPMENVKSVKQAEAPSSGRPPHRHNKALGSLKYAKQVRSQRDGGVLRRCADEERIPRMSVVGAPCTTPNPDFIGTYVTVFTSSSTKPDRLLGGGRLS